jgi:hypothetical protein
LLKSTSKKIKLTADKNLVNFFSNLKSMQQQIPEGNAKTIYIDTLELKSKLHKSLEGVQVDKVHIDLPLG